MTKILNLSNPKLVANQLKNDIDQHCAIKYDDGLRWHLGASLIGHKCKRYLWFVFRWCFKELHDGRQQRLFNRGHLEEKRFIEWLKEIGCQIWSEDENGKQFNITTIKGHFGGSLDAIMKLPPHYGINEPILGEFKTNGTGPGFAKLTMSGVAVEKPLHYAQMNVYGSDEKYSFNYAAYFNVCKNDDNLHLEVIKLDPKQGAEMRIKATEIIEAHIPPPRLSDVPTFYDCVYCPAKDVCHGNKPYIKNCRSCEQAHPVDNGEWFCSLHNGVIPRDFVLQGCGQYQPIARKA